MKNCLYVKYRKMTKKRPEYVLVTFAPGYSVVFASTGNNKATAINNAMDTVIRWAQEQKIPLAPEGSGK